MIGQACTGIDDEDLVEQVGESAVTASATTTLRDFEGEVHKLAKEEEDCLLVEGKRKSQARVVEVDECSRG